ncbi:ribonuclease HIII [Bacillus methanolicus PB1]|uniref:Ribonuclease HIII n=1 Tax=Bacillus methanolicus PB1 TaxID=997296 RepID=I3DY85_BACMT|nr:ribonuclease HIII [Bacillus methanolicus]EIJ79206.1 ribonuclease HIII [Bacillus methanolicus PB1]
MSNVVLKKNSIELEQIKKYYENYLLEKVPHGGLFSAKTENCTITAYKSGKILFQGNGAETEARKWGELEQPVSELSSMSVLGSDEVGTGDYFGPVTVAAAYVKKEDIPLLKDLGVKDSKHLTDEKIIVIAKQLINIVPHSLLTLHNEKYNQLQQSGMTQVKMKALLHNQAIGHVLNKIAPEKPEAVLIDQFVKEEIYFEHIKNEPAIQKDRVYFSTKAEGIHVSVAAASIIARYAFIRHFEKLSEAAGFTLPKGAGQQVDEAAAKLIKEKGRESLPKFVKLHFANTEKAIQLSKKI